MRCRIEVKRMLRFWWISRAVVEGPGRTISPRIWARTQSDAEQRAQMWVVFKLMDGEPVPVYGTYDGMVMGRPDEYEYYFDVSQLRLDAEGEAMAPFDGPRIPYPAS